MHHRHLRNLLLVTSSLAVFDVAEAAEPTSAFDGAAPAVEQVIVTAERRATDLQKTAIAISAFGQQVLADRKIDNIRDLSGQIPNLSISRVTISHTTQTYALRGVGEAVGGWERRRWCRRSRGVDRRVGVVGGISINLCLETLSRMFKV